MRSGRSFLVLLVLAAGLGAYIYFVEAKRDSSAPAAKAKVFGASAGLIDEVEVRAESGAITKVKRDGSSWQITEPAGVEGDTAQIATLVTTLDSLEVERVVDENPTAVAAYGLDPPRFSVAFRKEGETAQRRLQVGGKTPTGGDVYARVEGDPKVILIAAYLENSLNRTTFDLRNKAVLKFDPLLPALFPRRVLQGGGAVAEVGDDVRSRPQARRERSEKCFHFARPDVVQHMKERCRRIEAARRHLLQATVVASDVRQGCRGELGR
jgi:hypothetical protein